MKIIYNRKVSSLFRKAEKASVLNETAFATFHSGFKSSSHLLFNIQSGYQVVAAGQINFFLKTQVVVPVYDKMASIMPHS